MIKMGYKVELNKEDGSVEGIFVIVVHPILGMALIPVVEYIEMFVDCPCEEMETMLEAIDCMIEAMTDYEIMKVSV
jgi:hypothetical protein